MAGVLFCFKWVALVVVCAFFAWGVEKIGRYYWMDGIVLKSPVSWPYAYTRNDRVEHVH